MEAPRQPTQTEVAKLQSDIMSLRRQLEVMELLSMDVVTNTINSNVRNWKHCNFPWFNKLFVPIPVGQICVSNIYH